MTTIDGLPPSERVSTNVVHPAPTAATVIVRTLREVAANTPRERFWGSVRYASLSVRHADLTDDDLERRLERRMGQKLRDQLISHIFPNEQQHILSSPEPPFKLLAPITFRVRVLGYSSAILGLDVTGLSQLAHVFDDNFDAFAAFLTIYFPVAFSDALGANDLDTNFFDFAFSWQPSVTSSFSSRRTLPDDTQKKSWWQHLLSDRGRWYWLAVNGTLLVPAALAVGISWVLVEDARAQREAAAEYFKTVIQHEQILLSRFAERDAQIKMLNEALVKAVAERLDRRDPAEAKPAPSDGSSAPASQR